MRASINDCLRCAELLLANKADPQKASDKGNTSVMFAAQSSTRILELFLKNDIDLSKRNKQTLTALMLAIKSKNYQSAKILLEAGANPKRRNEQGQNSFDLAKEQPKLLKLLEQF